MMCLMRKCWTKRKVEQGLDAHRACFHQLQYQVALLVDCWEASAGRVRYTNAEVHARVCMQQE